VDGESAEGAAVRAVQIAKANAAYTRRRVEMAAAPAVRDTWSTPVEKDPFLVPLGEKADYLLGLWQEARAVPGVKYGSASFDASSEWKVFASSEGSLIEQTITRVSPGFKVTAVDATSGEFESRRHEIPPMQAGWEYVLASSLRTDARAVAEDAVRKLRSPSVTPGKKDLVIAPTNLWLTIHESIGHSTELDRALGYEADLAGTSFATPDKLGKLRYGPPTLTFYADKTTSGGLATCGYDDDGVKTGRWDLVKDGVLVAYQTTRDQAAFVGEKASRGTSYGQDFRSIQFQRMPNVSLAPGPAEKTAADLIAGVDDGIYVTGDGSWSIDHQRYNFQFGGQMFYEIKGGKLTGTLRDVAYQSNTLDFWGACDGIGGSNAWRLNGAMNDGKGEPVQSNAVSHGCPPARFRMQSIVNTNARKSKLG
jgi:TldD protein